jgi:hypothetical protein
MRKAVPFLSMISKSFKLYMKSQLRRVTKPRIDYGVKIEMKRKKEKGKEKTKGRLFEIRKKQFLEN